MLKTEFKQHACSVYVCVSALVQPMTVDTACVQGVIGGCVGYAVRLCVWDSCGHCSHGGFFISGC